MAVSETASHNRTQQTNAKSRIMALTMRYRQMLSGQIMNLANKKWPTRALRTLVPGDHLSWWPANIICPNTFGANMQVEEFSREETIHIVGKTLFQLTRARTILVSYLRLPWLAEPERKAIWCHPPFLPW